MYNLHKIHQLRHTLTQEAANTLALGIVISNLDYANAILFGLPDVVISRYQWIQNMAAKTVLNCSKYDSATEALRDVHWLPIRPCIQYKFLIIVYKCLDNSALDYLKNLLGHNPVTRPGLRSEAKNRILIVQEHIGKLLPAGPSVWQVHSYGTLYWTFWGQPKY